ncbi:hypothetical protein [Nocardioides sp. TF02-7]|uniref:hypothetical protein n=1 Tax=Nocardioides sp. TF02-7 TaxID=2917724 RepID=UPI001F06ACB7|nr:hypothetical protein [Nocardioides sp. TF02-7]UMG92657.1 hypothetical protein MF408_23390 [Nocardioides sp. TF02-7]
MRLRGAAATAAAGVLLSLLGACADDDPGSGADDGPAATASPTPSESPTRRRDLDKQGDAGQPGEDASDLAEMAEDLAGEQGEIPARLEPVQGADVSWPQCPKGMGIPEKRTLGLPMPVEEAEFVVIGLTNGPAFTPNPCLADQVAWVRERGLMAAAYAVTSFPDRATLETYGWDGPYPAQDRLGRLKNAGYQQARFNLDSMSEAGLTSPVVWIDVEPVPSFEWSDDKAANAAVVEGVARGYADAGMDIGVYSTPYLWDVVVGDFRLGGVPEWRAAGQTSRDEALARCESDWSIQGGLAVMGQWVADSRDHNITCPGISADLGRWFHQY